MPSYVLESWSLIIDIVCAIKKSPERGLRVRRVFDKVSELGKNLGII